MKLDIKILALTLGLTACGGIEAGSEEAAPEEAQSEANSSAPALPPALGDDCNATLAHWFDNAPRMDTRYWMTTNRNDSRYVSNTFGTMSFDGWWLNGDGDQVFSDRTVASCGGTPGGQPFSRAHADSLHVYVNRAGEIWFYNNTWGGWSYMRGQCAGDMVYAADGNTILSLSFSQSVVSIVK